MRRPRERPCGVSRTALAGGESRFRRVNDATLYRVSLSAMPAQPVRRKLTYRLYPTAAQSVVLDRLHEAHRQLYNAALEERISAWRHGRHSIGYADQCRSLTIVRRDDPQAWGSFS